MATPLSNSKYLFWTSVHTFSTINELQGETGLAREEKRTTEHVTTGCDVYTTFTMLLCVVGEELGELLTAIVES